MLRWLALAALAVVTVCVSAADAQQYDSSKDFDTLSAAGNTNPTGIWSDRTTMWVADSTDDKIYAYHMSNKSRDMSKDFGTLSPAGNDTPTGIWSDGTTMWVADSTDDKIYAYHMSNKSRDMSKDFGTLSPAGNDTPTGIWSDGTTMWVADSTDDKIYAYHMSNMSRDMYKDFDTLSAAGNTDPDGIWSDGTTMWVADAVFQNVGDKIYAYKMSDKMRVSTKDFNTLSNDAVTFPTGIWSDGTTMWVAQVHVVNPAAQIYAYKTHPAPTASPPRVFVYIPPPDTTPPRVVSIERTGNATTTDHTLTWDVRFSESVRVGLDVIHTNHTSVANATIPDLGTAHDTMLVDVPGMVTRIGVSVDLNHPITSGLLIELVAPDCTKFVIHNQTTTFLYKLRQPYDLGDLAGVGAAGQWTIYVHDVAKYWNGTLNGWTLDLESEGVSEGGGRTHTITQHVAGPGNYTLSLDGYDIRDRAGNPLADTDPKVSEPYHVVGTAARTCQVR